MIVSFLSQKGGVGKSTLARNLAVYATSMGWQALIADLDPHQGTSSLWAAERRRLVEAGARPHIEVRRYNSPLMVQRAARDFDLVVVDGPAHATQDLRPIALHSSLVVLPSAMNMDDLVPQITLGNELLDAGVPADRIAVAFCRVRASARRQQKIRDWMKDAPIAAIEPELREMPSIHVAQDRGDAACEVTNAIVSSEAQLVAAYMVERLGEPAL